MRISIFILIVGFVVLGCDVQVKESGYDERQNQQGGDAQKVVVDDRVASDKVDI